jgi:hypothetical protein
LSLAPCANAQERGGGGIGSLFGGSQDSASYGASASPSRLSSPSVFRQEAGGSYAVSRSSAGAWTVTGRASQLEFSRSPVVAETGLVVPAKLWNLQTGAGYSRSLGDRRRWGANVGVGSASDVPFRTIRETEFRASVFREIPSRERNSWLFFLSYSNNRTFANGAPLPGLAYVFREPVPGLEATVGLPFLSLRYRPSPDWRLALSVFGPTNVTVEASRRLAEPAWAYVAFERNPSQWLRAGRDTASDRLVFDRKQALAGLRFVLGAGVSLDLSGGWEFDRRVFEGRDANRSGVAKAALANAGTGGLRLTWRH